MATDYFAAPSHQGILAVNGKDAAKFLQGYVTCDLGEVTPGQWRLGAICNLQGRMVTSFRMVNQGDGYLLNMHAELVPSTIQFLQKYIAFFKAQMQDLSPAFSLLGLVGEKAASTITRMLQICPTADRPAGEADGNHVIYLGMHPERYELWVKHERQAEITDFLATAMQMETTDQWSRLEIDQGIGWVTGATSGEFIPQMMNLQLVDGISFTKGCYLGQEIVARMQYRGQLKKSMVRARVATKDAPIAGDALLDTADRRVGTVVSAAAASDGFELLAVVPTGEQPGCYHLATQDAIEVRSLPSDRRD